MSGFGARGHRGRRDNGLDAVEFAALGDVDPRIGEHLLDVLGIVGIAGYLAPSADLNPLVRATTLPSRPTDRLWVDRERMDEARGLLEAVEEDDAAGESLPIAPTLANSAGAIDVDAEWERIVAALESADDGPPARSDRPAEAGATRVPAGAVRPAESPDAAAPTEDRGEGTEADAELGDRTALPEVLDSVEDSVEESGRPPADADAGHPDGLAAEDDEGYTPPAPPPLPRLSREVGLALLAIGVGLLLFFRPGLLGIDAEVTLLLGVGAILGGVAALVYRLRDGWNDDDPDDRAVV